MSAAALDRAFLERVAEEADLNALDRVYQTTGDESLLAYGPMTALGGGPGRACGLRGAPRRRSQRLGAAGAERRRAAGADGSDPRRA